MLRQRNSPGAPSVEYAAVKRPGERPGRHEETRTVGYLAGMIAISFIVFGWQLWPIGWVLITALLIADFALDT